MMMMLIFNGLSNKYYPGEYAVTYCVNLHLEFSKFVFAILHPVFISKGSTILNIKHNIDSCMLYGGKY